MKYIILAIFFIQAQANLILEYKEKNGTKVIIEKINDNTNYKKMIVENERLKSINKEIIRQNRELKKRNK